MVVLSSIIFGATPIYMKFAALFGLNVLTFTFLRAVVVVFASIIIAQLAKIDIWPKGKMLRDVCLACFIGSGFMAFILSLSYDFLPSGMATSLHFTYPAIVMLVQVVFYKEKLGALRLLALGFSVLAVAMFIGSDVAINPIGIVLALGSGFCYSFFIISIEKSEAAKAHPLAISFYGAISCAVFSWIYNLFSNTITVGAVRPAGVAVLLLSIPFYSYMAGPWFQLGVRHTGAATASLLSTMEPVASIFLGILLLGEEAAPIKLLGSAFIILSTLMVVAGSSAPAAKGG